MTPLILNALAGYACALVKEGETKRSLEIYQLVHDHPQTPAIYLDLVEDWFPDFDRLVLQDRFEISEAMGDREPLERVVESVLKERNRF